MLRLRLRCRLRLRAGLLHKGRLERNVTAFVRPAADLVRVRVRVRVRARVRARAGVGLGLGLGLGVECGLGSELASAQPLTSPLQLGHGCCTLRRSSAQLRQVAAWPHGAKRTWLGVGARVGVRAGVRVGVEVRVEVRVGVRVGLGLG